MIAINFYRQLRRDGAIRTGVDVDGETVLSHFQSGRRANANPDPAIEWYVDVRFNAPRLPTEPEAVREWLLKHEGAVCEALEKLAASVPAGLDPGDWPIKQDFRVGATRGAIVCSAVRRVAARQISEILRDIASKWREYVGELLVPQPN